LVGISSMPHFKVCIGIFEVVTTLRVIESISHVEMDEDHICIRTNSIDFSTFIPCLIRSQVLGCSMSDHFLCSCVVFVMSIAIRVFDRSRVVSSFIMITFSVKGKTSNQSSHSVVLGFKIFTPFDVTQIFSE
jgi:hypothetical protein